MVCFDVTFTVILLKQISIKSSMSLAFSAPMKTYICQCIISLDVTSITTTMGPKENYRWKEITSEKLKA